MGKIEIPNFEKEEYLETTAPYEWLYAHRQNRLELKQLTNRMAEMAMAFGIRNFPSLFQEYLASLQEIGNSTMGENCTDFYGQEQALWCGSWIANDSGIRMTDRFGTEIIACQHPILPVRRLVNIDTGLEKIELAYK